LKQNVREKKENEKIYRAIDRQQNVVKETGCL
jgi:hypothetical protein